MPWQKGTVTVMLSEKIIEIKSVTVNEDGEEDTIEMTTVGKFGVRDGKAFVSYDDSNALGVEGVTTVLHADSDRVILKRTGGLQSQLEIEKGERHQCHYSTAFGELQVGIYGESIENRLRECGGKLKMAYTVDVNCRLMSHNQVEITVKEG